jgi:excisionase family DNA binding protein
LLRLVAGRCETEQNSAESENSTTLRVRSLACDLRYMGTAIHPNHERWWVTQKVAAERLGVTTPTVRRMIADGDLPTVRVGRRRVVRVVDLDRIISGQAAS